MSHSWQSSWVFLLCGPPKNLAHSWVCVFFYLPPKEVLPNSWQSSFVCPFTWASKHLWPIVGSQVGFFLLLGRPSSWPEVGNQILLCPCTWAFQIVFVSSWQSRFFIPFYLGLQTSLAHSWQSSWVLPFTWASQFLARSGQSNFVVSMYLGLSNCFCE